MNKLFMKQLNDFNFSLYILCSTDLYFCKKKQKILVNSMYVVYTLFLL